MAAVVSGHSPLVVVGDPGRPPFADGGGALRRSLPRRSLPPSLRGEGDACAALGGGAGAMSPSVTGLRPAPPPRDEFGEH